MNPGVLGKVGRDHSGGHCSDLEWWDEAASSGRDEREGGVKQVHCQGREGALQGGTSDGLTG